jgi:hypothetical protein
MGNPNWKKGQSAHPETQFQPGHRPLPGGGRPKALPIIRHLEAILEEEVDKREATRLKLKGKNTYTRAIVLVMMRKALLGDIAMIRTILEYVEGKPLERVRVEGDLQFQGTHLEGLTREEVIEQIRLITERARIREAKRLESLSPEGNAPQ